MDRYLPKTQLILFFLVMISITLGIISCQDREESNNNPLTRHFQDLDEVVNKKKNELDQYLKMIEESFSSIQDNGPLINSFGHINSIFNKGIKKDNINQYLATIEKAIIEIYLSRFMVFENIHFINRKGDIFYSLIKNPMTLTNVFGGRLATTALSKKLHSSPDHYMVDFDLFPGLDPAAFFIHPIYKNNALLGWCVFELGADRLDTIFSSAEKLGQTGEVFLVNERSVMLTNSYFSPDLSALKQHLSQENIAAKFNRGHGHLVITDYRGYQALTSFEVVTYHGVRWLIVAKKDLDEVITQKFMENPQGLYQVIRERIQARNIAPVRNTIFPTSENEVRLDQFKRAGISEDIYTHGVSTCTAVLVSLPGKFSYLAHISAYDVLYGGKGTDIIGNVLNRIRKYEVPDYLLRELRIYIITPHIQFDQNILKVLVNQGLLLSQVFVAKNPQAKLANVYHNVKTNQGSIEWEMKAGPPVIENLSSLKNVGSFLSEISGIALEKGEVSAQF